MRWLGLVLAIVGLLGVLSSIQSVMTEFDLADEHKLSMWMGGLGVWMLVGLVGFSMWLRRSRKGDGLVACAHCGRRNARETTICPRCEQRLPGAGDA